MSRRPSSLAVLDTSSNIDPASKRRKLRKEDTCVGCQQRGIKCVSQDLPEASLPAVKKGDRIGNRVVRVEALIEQLVKKIGRDGSTESGASAEHNSVYANGIPTPASTYSDASVSKQTQILPSAPSKYHELYTQLYKALPCRRDLEILCQTKTPNAFPLFHELLTIPYARLDKDGLESVAVFLDSPSQQTHPVIAARYMLRLVAYLQHPYLSVPEKQILLSEPLSTIISRLVSVSTKLVTSNDELIANIEGLECLMLESQYHLNIGNLRRSWMAIRKTITLAQLMGLDRQNHEMQFPTLDPTTRADTQVMWFRMNAQDRHVCLMLGLPQASHDRTMADEELLAADTPDGRIERMHCALQSRLLERHDSGGKFASCLPLRELDQELQKIAKTMPSTWWLLPNFASIKDDSKRQFWELRRLIVQLNHYNLLLQLHNPHILTSSPCGGCDYSKRTCTTAAQEVLSRYIVYRSTPNSGFGCRTIEFFALTAALTLVLAYLDGYRTASADNFPGHQYMTDRGMMEQAQLNMEQISRETGDSLSGQSADLLRRLLAIEAQAAAGHTDSVERVIVQPPEKEVVHADDDSSVVRVHIPYFGVIKIAREGVISKERAMPKHTVPEQIDPDGSSRQSLVGNPKTVNSTAREPTAIAPDPQLAGIDQDAALAQQEFPSLVAGIDDWAFQGVDMAFFDNLMSGIIEDN
ncbi:Dehydrocurvularin biosynthesis regulator [Paramyrothecium foliicola]|nr:Dehydrocurvularin biosynthesis regulator [Paramyrothecium foliicola]